MKNDIKISIITPTFNSAETLETTILSVLNQTYKNIEYIIIDGASTDKTLEIVADYQKKIPLTLISEPDRGLYDAMNKGVKSAHGDWILFLNSDDYFYSPDSLLKVRPYLDDDADIVYGATEFRYANFGSVRPPRPMSDLWKKMPFNHQSSLTRRSWLLRHPFDLEYHLAADYDFLIYAYKNGANFREADVVISSFGSGGASTKYQGQAIREYEIILKRYKLSNYKVYLYYRLLSLKPFFKKIAPEKIKRWVYDHLVH
jgi:glycosyltransferase involved in cell wall biosynthesis